MSFFFVFVHLRVIVSVKERVKKRGFSWSCFFFFRPVQGKTNPVSARIVNYLSLGKREIVRFFSIGTLLHLFCLFWIWETSNNIKAWMQIHHMYYLSTTLACTRRVRGVKCNAHAVKSHSWESLSYNIMEDESVFSDESSPRPAANSDTSLTKHGLRLFGQHHTVWRMCVCVLVGKRWAVIVTCIHPQ